MFKHGFPPYWSTIKKLIWLVGTGVAGGAGALKTITGTIVSFIAKKVTPIKELKVAIEPVQSGSGDPSPDNVRPITGWTGCRVVDAEELYLYFPNSGTTWGKYGITIDYLGNGKYHIYGTSTSSSYLDTIRTNSFKIPSGTGRKCEFNNSQAGISVRFMNGSSVTDTWSNISLNRVTDGYIAMAGKTTDGFAVMVSSGTTVDLTMQIIFSKNMSVDIPISWETEAGTVYYGSATYNGDGTWTIQPVFVKASVTRNFFANASSISYEVENNRLSIRNAFYDSGNGVIYRNRSRKIYGYYCISNVFKVLALNNTNYISSQYRLYIDAPAGVTDKTTLLNLVDSIYAGGGTIDFLYQPTDTIPSYTVTTEQLFTLKGENNVWADIGDVTVTAAGIKEITPSSAQALNMLLGGMYTNNHTADDVSDDEALDIILGGSNA
jgi:hypothetical protein